MAPSRYIFNVALTPVVGSRFQPTGFPDVGTGRFSKPRPNGHWVDAVIVESEQSMANHLEDTGWNRGRQAPMPELVGLPYVQVVNKDGEFLTSSRTEAHRLSSAFIRESVTSSDNQDMVNVLRERLDLKDDAPLSSRAIAKAIFALDPACLVHGVFFADTKLPGQPKITRALTSFVEAIDVRPAEYGGVKRDDVRHKNAEDGGSTEGYGSIPFHKTLWTAQEITASFVIDRSQIASYGLGDNATRLVEVLALWEIRALLNKGLRLRSMCDLAVQSGDEQLASADELAAEMRSLISACASELGEGGPLTVIWSGGKKAPKDKS
jgi:CRISPR-associated protein Csb1